MKCKPFNKDIHLSMLGMGAMRLPQTAEGFAKPIDTVRAEEIIDYCMANGVNYYDTAYIYHGGNSEVFLGNALKKYPRDTFYVADKFNIQANADYQAQFREQLDRLQMEYIDFYLLHGITDYIASDYQESGCIAYFLEQKARKKIRFFGFSFHGTPEKLRELVKMGCWDFVQIQLNYYDWFHGTAKEQYEILAENNIPVMVMEPVHGGMLAALPGEIGALLPAGPQVSPAAWALRFAASLPGVSVVLSGMSTLEQARENIETFSGGINLTAEECGQLEKVSEQLHKHIAVTCTGCRYCCGNCPKELDIPLLLTAYNEYKSESAALGDGALAAWRLNRLKALPPEKQPSACIGCGACKKHCPQDLDIPAYMREMAQYLQ